MVLVFLVYYGPDHDHHHNNKQHYYQIVHLKLNHHHIHFVVLVIGRISNCPVGRIVTAIIIITVIMIINRTEVINQ